MAILLCLALATTLTFLSFVVPQPDASAQTLTAEAHLGLRFDASEDATCAVTDQQRLICWGENLYGELGFDQTTTKYLTTPTEIPGVPPVVSVSVGERHVCFVHVSGEVSCLGDGIQAGNAQSFNTSFTPVPIAGITTAVAVSAGAEHSCALLSDATVSCWGRGLLGDGNDFNLFSNDVVSVTGLTNVSSVSAGSGHTCAAQFGGQVLCWGENSSGQLGDGSTNDATVPIVSQLSQASDIDQISTLEFSTCVLAAGEVDCAGRDYGTGVHSVAITGALSIDGDCAVTATRALACWDETDDPEEVPGFSDVLAIAQRSRSRGDVFSSGTIALCAISINDRVRCQGENTSSQVGNGATPDFPFATQAAPGLTEKANVGEGVTCRTIFNLGTLSCFGEAEKLGIGLFGSDPYFEPQPVFGVEPVQDFDAGLQTYCAVKSSGLKCWGRLLNDGLVTTINYRSPVDIPGLDGVLSVSVGSRALCAREQNGATVELYCWGQNDGGRIGDNTTTASDTPVLVPGASDSLEVATGPRHTCARSASWVRCWGRNTNGELGTGTTTDSLVPVDVDFSALGGPGQVTGIAVGQESSCALLATQQVACWGSNEDGQLGVGTTVDALTPQLLNLTNVTALSHSDDAACAIADGLVYCWGGVNSTRSSRTSGKLGNGTFFGSRSPVPVLTPDGTQLQAQTVDIARAHACAVNAAKELYCWGDNSYGQLGTNDTLSPWEPDVETPFAFFRSLSPNDADGDYRWDGDDNCSAVANTLQENLDGDNRGDVCDPDADGDGAGGPLGTDNDCDDFDATRFPGATEVPDDGIDQDCDGEDLTTTPNPAGMCNGQLVTIDLNITPGASATAGDDVILGTPGNDVIDGLAGNDTICGQDGDDTITGGSGNDTVLAGSGDDTVLGDEGDDTIMGEAGRDILRGGPGIDEVHGGDGNDRVLGGIGDDNMTGGDGNDYLGGFGGADTINGGSGNEVIFGGFGPDTINGGAGDDAIFGLIGDDTINGGTGNDKLNGDRGNDTIDGNVGNDELNGGNANDILTGGAGNDSLNGGKADDTLDGGTETDICAGNLGTDTATNCETTFGIP